MSVQNVLTVYEAVWKDPDRLCLSHLFVRSHDEMSPFLHRPGGADFSVGDVGWDEAQEALQEDL